MKTVTVTLINLALLDEAIKLKPQLNGMRLSIRHHHLTHRSTIRIESYGIEENERRSFATTLGTMPWQPRLGGSPILEAKYPAAKFLVQVDFESLAREHIPLEDNEVEACEDFLDDEIRNTWGQLLSLSIDFEFCPHYAEWGVFDNSEALQSNSFRELTGGMDRILPSLVDQRHHQACSRRGVQAPRKVFDICYQDGHLVALDLKGERICAFAPSKSLLRENWEVLP